MIRRDVGPPKQSALAAYGIGAAAVAALLVWQAGDAKLGLIVLGGFGVGLLVFAIVGFGALRATAALAPFAGLSWRYGLASLRRRARTNTVQIIALSLGLTAILLLSFTRGDLLDTWRSKTPADAPNRFIVGIQPEQREPLAALFAENRIAAPTTYPMVRGRYVALNGNAGRRRRLQGPRAPAGRARVQPVVHERPPGPQPGERRRLVRAGRPRVGRAVGRGGDREVARLEARRPADLGGRRAELHRADHQPAQARLGFDAGELLRDHHAEAPRRLPDELRDELPPAGGAGRAS